MDSRKPGDPQPPLQAFDFHEETNYSQATVGPGRLRKVFLTFPLPFDAAELVDVKLQTNAWEREYALTTGHAEARPVEPRPGYLTLAKLVLASTKDFAHGI